MTRHQHALVLLVAALGTATALLLLAGLSAGSEGFSLHWQQDATLIGQLRAPRSLGAFAAGALLGLAGAIAQGLFRNPLADPYLLGSAAGAGLGVVGLIFLGSLAGSAWQASLPQGLQALGVAGAAFLGALLGMGLTLLMAGGAARPLLLLLSGVVVGVLLTALADLMMLLSPEALRGKQAFLLGSTAFLGWGSLGLMAASAAAALPLAWRFAGVLDALVLGEDSAASLGLALPRLRLLLVALLALCTGVAVAQVGLVAFVGLAAPHLVRRSVTVTHGPLLLLSAWAGGVLLLAADVAARSLIAPQELPVGLLTAVVGGVYLLLLLRRQLRPQASERSGGLG